MSFIESVRESDVKSWLQVALSDENIENISVKITGGTEKGDGYLSDILFATVTGTDKSGMKKHIDLALKCSKSNEALVEKVPAMKDAFLNEIHVFSKVFPAFKRFQIERDIENPFDSIPRCYGIFNDEVKKVIVMENLKQSGYGLWNLKIPLTRQHIDLVIREYGKLHAISVAMEEQEPRKFQELVTGLDTGVLKRVLESFGLIKNMEDNMEDIYHLLKGDLDENILGKFLAFKQQVRFVLYDMFANINDLKVIVHGDCWSNNFMYKHTVEDKTAVSKVTILDWQIANYSSPILDLSYFLFSCIREEDLNDIDTILKDYYDSFCSYLKRLGSNFWTKYTLNTFLNEWKKYGKYGVAMCLLPVKASHAEKADLPDMAESAENEDLNKTFLFQIRDQNGFKNRVKPIIKYAVANLI